MNKRVLLIMPNYSGIYKMLVNNLKSLGFEVMYLDIKTFKYKNIQQRVYCFLKKTFLKDKHYKQYLRGKNIEKNIIEKCSNNYFDYTLIIHPCDFLPSTIQYLKTISKKVIAYHWEGFDRFKASPNLIKEFNSFAVFDKKDYDTFYPDFPNIKLTQSFYFDILPIPENKSIDLLYIGANLDNRYDNLKHISSISNDKKTYYYLYDKNKKLTKFNNIIISDSFFEYKDAVNISAKAKCVIDMKLSVHNGLSLRFFEALHFSQKIITNNKTVKEMDFYNPNNILIINDFKELTESMLNDFLNKEYIEIHQSIKQQYSFKNWFNNISK